MSSLIAIEDDQERDKCQTAESYSVDKAWTRSGKDGTLRCEFYPSTIAALMKKPVDTDRKLPVGISYPQHPILRTEVTLPQAWPVGAEQKPIRIPPLLSAKIIGARAGGW